ncbi:MAG: VOC family protein [Bdellovibrionota bacterium]
MKSINVYLTFNGNCAQAMKFYEKCLGGTLFMMPFSEAPMPEMKQVKDRVMHARLTSGNATLMASDTMPEHTFTRGNNFSVSIDCASSDEVGKLFAALSAGGKVTMPPQDTFWGAHFAMCTDQFGVQWMFNHDKK